jgi:hypothetical protein
MRVTGPNTHDYQNKKYLEVCLMWSIICEHKQLTLSSIFVYTNQWLINRDNNNILVSKHVIIKITWFLTQLLIILSILGNWKLQLQYFLAW